MPLQVLHIINRVPWPVKDGGTLAHYNLLKGLHDAGCQVTVAALNTSKHHVDVNALPVYFTDLCKLYTTPIDNRVKPLDAFLNLFTQQSYNMQRFVSNTFEQQLVSLVTKQPFDLVIFDGLFITPYLQAVRAHTQAKIILRQHNTEYKVWESLAANTRQPIKKRYINLLAKRLKMVETSVLNQVDALITLTEQDKTDLRQLGCTKPILVSPVGMEFKTNTAAVSSNPKAVFNLGAMDWMPNVQAMEWFIKEVWPIVTHKHPDAIFYLAGKKMPDSFKAHQSAQLQVVGEVPDALAFMADKQLMVVPLFAGSGIRVKILEGMSMGKTIISTTLGVQGIGGTANQHYVIADTATDFAQAIIAQLENPTQAIQLGKQAQAYSQQTFDNHKVTQQILQFVATL
jgi:polysaccharide biosynthesis protein PslH